MKRTQKHDQIKNEFCREKHIPLLRIKYSQTNFEELVMLFLKDLKFTKNWYNPFLSYEDYYDTLEEDLYLEKYYPDKGGKWVSQYLHRSPQACAGRANKLGLHRSNRWTREEDAFLIEHYPQKNIEWIAKKLNRTKSSILHRTSDLNLKMDINRWKRTEDEYIVKYYNIKK